MVAGGIAGHQGERYQNCQPLVSVFAGWKNLGALQQGPPFRCDLPSGEKYRESNTVAGGDEARLADTPWGKIGLSICYDIRFPRLYREMAKKGAFAFTAPSAFTETTGKAHWHVLLRARAIENGAFVIAPAQGGLHANGRRTYGHSLIVGPGAKFWRRAEPNREFLPPKSIRNCRRKRAPKSRAWGMTGNLSSP